jgi:hypothetical protein
MSLLNLPLSDLAVSIRLLNILASANITTLSQLVEKSANELMAIRYFSKRNLKEVLELVELYGYKLKMKQLKATAKEDCSITVSINLNSFSSNNKWFDKGESISGDVYIDKPLPGILNKLGNREVIFYIRGFYYITYSKYFEYSEL